MVHSMPFEAPLVVTYGSRLSASTPWAIVSVPLGVGAAAAGCAVGAAAWAGAAVGFGAGGAVGAATGGVVGLTAGAVVGAGAGAAVGRAGALGAHAASTLPPMLRPSSPPRRTNSRRFMWLLSLPGCAHSALSPSPSKLVPKTASKMANPGHAAFHHATANTCLPSFSMPPQVTVDRGTPTPR